jgi:methionyl-tRNA formyltransferase
MRIVFLGTPPFAVSSLDALLAAGHEVLAVFTQPDRPKGRSQSLTASAVKHAALARQIPVFQPERIRRPESVEQLLEYHPDLMVVVGYGQIIPQSIIDIPPHGILNVHASLLPKYRGAAPIQWAIANGETETGVTIMRIDAGLDTGDMLRKVITPISPVETAPELSERLATLGAAALIETLRDVELGLAKPEKQNSAEATLAPMLKKEDGLADWSLPAATLYNRWRGFDPWPGLHTTLRGQGLQIWRAQPVSAVADAAPGSIADAPPGAIRILKKRVFAVCGDGAALELLDLQLAGKKRMPVEPFLNGYHLTEKDTFGDLT